MQTEKSKIFTVLYPLLINVSRHHCYAFLFAAKFVVPFEQFGCFYKKRNGFCSLQSYQVKVSSDNAQTYHSNVAKNI